MTDGAKRVRKHREKMKAAGLKPVTIWVPDVNAPGYREQLAARYRASSMQMPTACSS